MCVRVCVRVVGWEEGGIRGLAFTRAPRAPRAPTRRSVISIPGEVGHWGAELQTPLNGGAAGCGLGPEPRALLFLLYPGAFPGTGRQARSAWGPCRGTPGPAPHGKGRRGRGHCGLASNTKTYAQRGWAASPPARGCPGGGCRCRRPWRSPHRPPSGRGWRREKEGEQTREKKEYVTTENPGAMESLPPLFPLSLAGVWLGSAQLLHSHVRGADALGCQV